MKIVKKRSQISGMWKIAYADFMTAMMVLFFMLWIVNNVTEEQLYGLGDYFSPTAVKERAKENNLNTSSPQKKSAKRSILARKLQTKLQKFSDNIMVMENEESIMITVISTTDKRLFSEKSFHLSNAFREELKLIANEIKGTAFYISVVAHTNGAEFAPNLHYSNLELAADRASSIRQALLEIGIESQRIFSIVGAGDILPLENDRPTSIKNRRIDIKLLKGKPQVGQHRKNTPGIFH